MIVFDLRCSGAHVFEAWFASSAAFEEQRERGLLCCPICGDGTIGKAAMAPNIPAKGNRRPTRIAETPEPAPTPQAVKDALRTLARAQAEAIAKSEWVGPRFADRARKMHDGEEPAVPIYGQATLAEARALVEDGVAVAPLAFPVVTPEALN